MRRLDPLISAQTQSRLLTLASLIFLLAAGLLALHSYRNKAQFEGTRSYHFGTWVDTTIMASPSEALLAQQEIDQRMNQWHQRWHAWQTSELTALNDALQEGKIVQPEPDVAVMIRRSQKLSEEMDGLFNPALGQRIADWGFARTDMNTPAPAPAPVDPKTLPTMADLQWTSAGLRSLNPHLRLDLGGIAKGYALDALLAGLKKRGISNALVNIGGDVGALGQHRNRPWLIGIENPDGDTALARLELFDGERVFTSGTYARHHATESGQAHHIIDPRTGAPAEGNIAVTVLGSDSMRLQAAGKALLITGSNWPALAARLHLEEVLVINAAHGVEISAKMAKRLERSGSLPAQFQLRQ